MSTGIDYLLSPEAVREKSGQILELTKSGATHFQFNEDKLPEVANFVLDVIKENYPSLKIPFHSRWGHFQVGAVDRNGKFEEKINAFDPLEQARCKIDLAITSVLLDAGAGASWRYIENGVKFARSEGLAVASWHMFVDGAFSEDGKPVAQATKLRRIEISDIEKYFQVSASNPLVGASGRAGLLRALGECVASKKEVFRDGRPGNIIDYLIKRHGSSFKAKDLLSAVLSHFGSIWPSRLDFNGVYLGDVWEHPKLGSTKAQRLIPFHKLSQWLTYSLIEPIQDAGLKISAAHELTGLAEYRNGGLLVDMGLLELKDPAQLKRSHRPDSELIIEWRALTIACLDLLAPLIRENLGFDEEEFPLAKILEGGTWAAGRKIAARKRADSSPPITLDSDGTVF